MQSSKGFGMFSRAGVRIPPYPHLPCLHSFYFFTTNYTLYPVGQAPGPNSQATHPRTPRLSRKPTSTPIPIPTRTPARAPPIPARDPLEMGPAAAAPAPDMEMDMEMATGMDTGTGMVMVMVMVRHQTHPRPHPPGHGRDPALAKTSGIVGVSARMTGL